jgi:hypothetical protein
MAKRRKATYTRKPKKKNGWWSFWVIHPQGSYKMSAKTRKEARKDRWDMENRFKMK